jgi:hypothetical protein
VPSSIRRLPAPTCAQSPAPAAVSGDALRLDCGDEAPSLTAPSPARRAVVAPLALERYKVQFTANAEMYEKLRLAQDLLRHQVPDGDVGQVIDRALTALIKDLTKQKFAATDRPHRNRDLESRGTVPNSRHVPAEVRRTVWSRDGGRCAFIARNGRRCTERAFLEFHHVVPHGAGGEATAENIQLRCRAHNAYEAELYFGQRTAPWESLASAVKEARASYQARTDREPLRSWRGRSSLLGPDRVGLRVSQDSSDVVTGLR